MITAIHTLVYSDDPTATRAFFKDVLRWPFVSEGDQGDAGTGSGTGGEDPAEWLIFGTGPSELGVHPTAGEHDGQPYRSPRHHSIAVMCDNLDATVAELAGRGAEFASEAHEMGFGRDIATSPRRRRPAALPAAPRHGLRPPLTADPPTAAVAGRGRGRWSRSLVAVAGRERPVDVTMAPRTRQQLAARAGWD